MSNKNDETVNIKPYFADPDRFTYVMQQVHTFLEERGKEVDGFPFQAALQECLAEDPDFGAFLKRSSIEVKEIRGCILLHMEAMSKCALRNDPIKTQPTFEQRRVIISAFCRIGDDWKNLVALLRKNRPTSEEDIDRRISEVAVSLSIDEEMVVDAIMIFIQEIFEANRKAAES